MPSLSPRDSEIVQRDASQRDKRISWQLNTPSEIPSTVGTPRNKMPNNYLAKTRWNPQEEAIRPEPSLSARTHWHPAMLEFPSSPGPSSRSSSSRKRKEDG